MSKQEDRIIRALIKNLDKAGFKPAAVWTEETYVMKGSDGKLVDFDRGDQPEKFTPMSVDDVLSVFKDYDMYAPTLHFGQADGEDWGEGVMLVPGNENDLISDWHCGNPVFDKAVDKVADKAGEGEYA